MTRSAMLRRAPALVALLLLVGFALSLLSLLSGTVHLHGMHGHGAHVPIAKGSGQDVR